MNTYQLENPDLECEDTAKLIEMILMLYCNVTISESDIEPIKEKINSLLNIRIKVIPPEYNENDIKELNKLLIIETILTYTKNPEWYNSRNERLTAYDLATAIDKNRIAINKLIMNKCGIKEEWNPGPQLFMV